MATPQNSGHLVPLKTLQELEAALETTNVYTLPIPAKSANEILSALRPLLPAITEIQHLRRLIKPSFLPAAVSAKTPPLPDFFLPDVEVLYLLVCPTSQISQRLLEETLLSLRPFSESNPPTITILKVPAYPPTSAEQAQEWSSRFWPTVYKRGNPFGPHPAIVHNAELRLGGRAGEYIALAREVGEAASAAGVGYKFGAVVVEPETGEVVAVAGDGRLRGCGKGWGNPLDHAVMRVVGMVAQKRVDGGVEVAPDNVVRPQTELEKVYFGGKKRESLLGDAGDGGGEQEDGDDDGNDDDGNDDDGDNDDGAGYLCHGMHIYLSHEPCVMCSMALLHSRVGAVVFGKRMEGSGALTAEGGRGYGLFWRPELNWRFLCWEWREEEEERGETAISV